MTLMRTTHLSSLVATVVLGASAAPRTEVIPLNNRTADDVMAVAQSVIGSEGKVTAYGTPLIDNAEPPKIGELQSVL
ncbi:secretin, partial [Pseudomonas aeruginosa]